MEVRISYKITSQNCRNHNKYRCLNLNCQTDPQVVEKLMALSLIRNNLKHRFEHLIHNKTTIKKYPTMKMLVNKIKAEMLLEEDHKWRCQFLRIITYWRAISIQMLTMTFNQEVNLHNVTQMLKGSTHKKLWMFRGTKTLKQHHNRWEHQVFKLRLNICPL